MRTPPLDEDLVLTPGRWRSSRLVTRVLPGTSAD